MPGSPDLPNTDSIRMAMNKRATKGRGYAIAWVLFLLAGIPFGLMAALGPFACAGIYVEPLRSGRLADY